MSAVIEEKRLIELPAESFSRREERELPALAQPANATPMSMLAVAVQKGMDVATIKDLMALQERWEANEARKAYAAALAAFKENPPTVYKDKENKQYESMYTTIGNLVNTINAALSAHGLSAHWEIGQSDGIAVTCVLTHRAGHSERVSMSGPPDDSGKKNPLQQIKSTITYLKIATYEAVTGTASADGNADDDGNVGKGMPDDEYQEFAKRIEAETTKAAAKKVWQEGVAACEKLGDVATANKLKAVLLAHGEFIDSANKVTA